MIDKKNNSKEQMSAKTTLKSSLPSDALFKTIMEDVIAAREFLEHYLPDDFKELIDLSTVKVEKESFVEDDLKRALSDVVYSIKTKEGEDAYAYVLIEQQTKPDYLIAYRLWKYMLLLVDRYIKKNGISSSNNKCNTGTGNASLSNKSKLPLIAPIVFYNGTKKYNAPLNLWDLFSNPELAKKLMANDYKLVDLQSMSDDEIKQKAHFGMIEYFMKHIQTRDILKLWSDFLASFEEIISIDKERGYIYIKHLLWYSDSKVPEDKQQELNNLILDNLNKTDGENIMRTIAQKYREEGIEQGIYQGRQEGEQIGIAIGRQAALQESRIAIARKMLSKQKTIEEITEFTELTRQEIENLI